MMIKGEDVEVTFEHRTVIGKIEMISDNQVSLLVSFEAVLGGHAGMMAATRHDKERHIYRSIIDGTPVTIRSKQR